MKTKVANSKSLLVSIAGALFLLCALVCSKGASAQIFHSTSPEKEQTRNGNKEFKKENYADAEANYKKALDKKNNMPEAVFNLGDAVYKQKRYGEAAQQFDLSSKTNSDPMIKAKALHNLGNSYMEEKKYEDAVRSYKNALRWNPNDKDTKYNLAYANEMLRQKNQQQQQDDKNNDKKDKDKKEEKKEEKKDQRPDSNQDQQQAENKQGENKDQKQQAPKPRLTRQDAEKLLQALNNEEQKTNQKMQQKQVKANGVKILKDW